MPTSHPDDTAAYPRDTGEPADRAAWSADCRCVCRKEDQRDARHNDDDDDL